MDDFPADDTTSGVYNIFDLGLPARLEEAGDVDWIRVKGLQKYFFYDVWLFRSTDEDYISHADLSLYNSSSQMIWDPRHTERVPGMENYHHFGDNEDHFIAVRSGQVGGYRIYIRSGDYANDSFDEASNFAPTQFGQFASALENNDDVDFLKYRLFAGTEYSFNLLGKESNSTHETTLARKTFRLFDLAGNMVAEDDASTANRSATISFTPDETAEYIFEVDSDAATGSYIIESADLDDHQNDSTTDSELPLDGTEVLGQANYDFLSRIGRDQDWFRINPIPGFTYQVESNHASLALRNQAGDYLDVEYIKESFSDNSNRKFQFRNDSGVPLFVSAGQLQADETNYTLAANIADDHIATFRDATNFSENSATVGTISGAIETEGDRDWIRINLRNFANYRFTVNADPELAMAVSVRDTDGNVIANGSPFQPLNFFLQQFPTCPFLHRRAFQRESNWYMDIALRCSAGWQ